VTQTGRYHGGLVFFGYEDTLLDQFGRIVSATLEDYGHPVERQSVLNAHEARITASHYQVKLTVTGGREASDQARRSRRIDTAGRLNPGRPRRADTSPCRLVIDLIPADTDGNDKDISQLLLVVMLYRLVDVCAVSAIEWLDPATVLTLSQFLGAFSDVSPQRVRGRQQIMGIDDNTRFAPVDDTERDLSYHYDAIAGQRPHDGETGLIQLTEEELLALAFRSDAHPDEMDAASPEDQAQSDIRRLATWGLTGMMVFLSAPVAASMAAVNLARGEDFRLNTNVLSLTGLLVVLQSSGALASAVALLPI
jgi:hypothetical protein